MSDTADGRRIGHRHSDTAEATAAMRAAESLLPVGRRLIDDPIARDLVRRWTYALAARSRLTARLALALLDLWFPGLHGHVVLRARYADDAILEATAAGVSQIVLLGAGFDSTAFRLAVPALLFDVDVAATQRAKRERLAAAGHEPRTPMAYVPCTLGTDDLTVRLRGSGFDPTLPALFVWLGVVPYLGVTEFMAALGDIGRLSAPGSRLILDYVDRTVLDGSTRHRGARRVERMVSRRGEPLRMGLTSELLRHQLGQYAFDVQDDFGLADLAARYATSDGARYETDSFNRIASATKAQ